MGKGAFLGVKSGRGVTLTPHPLLVPSWKGRAIPLLPLWAVRPVQSLSACIRVTFTFTSLFIPFMFLQSTSHPTYMHSMIYYFMYQLPHVSSPRCHPHGIITKEYKPTCQYGFCLSLQEWLKFYRTKIRTADDHIYLCETPWGWHLGTETCSSWCNVLHGANVRWYIDRDKRVCMYCWVMKYQVGSPRVIVIV